MRQLARNELPADTLQRLCKGIPFFNELLRNSPEQFDILLDSAVLLEPEADELVIHNGDTDTNLYFLLKGQLLVLADDSASAVEAINRVSPGEVFGTMSMVLNAPRTASVKAGVGSLLLGIDFKHFNDLAGISLFGLTTRISFYKMVVHHLRWTLEMNKSSEPNHELVAEIRKLPIYTGPKDTDEELQSLRELAPALANILNRWNLSLQPSL